MIALNEARFRAANERIERVGRALDEQRIPFLCECGDDRCTRAIVLTLVEYEEVRAHPARFVVRAGHEFLEAEVVVDAVEGYTIVEKTDRSRRLVEAADPRA